MTNNCKLPINISLYDYIKLITNFMGPIISYHKVNNNNFISFEYSDVISTKNK